jgi:hypothetical protein
MRKEKKRKKTKKERIEHEVNEKMVRKHQKRACEKNNEKVVNDSFLMRK